MLAGKQAASPGWRRTAACYGGHQFGSWAGCSSATVARSRSARSSNADARDPGSSSSRGAGPIAVTAARRWSRGAGARAAARAGVQRGDVSPRRAPDDARALARRDRRDRDAATCSTTAIRSTSPARVVCRVAPTFLRFGSYETTMRRAASFQLLDKLVQYTLARHFPAARDPRRRHVHRDRAHDRVAGERVDARRLRARRDEHRQHVDPRAPRSTTARTAGSSPFDLDWTPNITDASG